MMHYFDSENRKAADRLYNNGQYNEALIHYKEAYEVLVRMGAQRGFKGGKQYDDALTYAFTDIITTNCDVIMHVAKTDLDEAKEMFDALQNTVNEMETVYERIKTQADLESAKKIPSVYKALACTCEEFSDLIMDAVDQSGNFHDKEQILAARVWLKKYSTYQDKAGEPTELRIHLGYLYLVERAYKADEKSKYMRKILEYIQDNQLLELDLTPLQEIEMRCYQLFAAVETEDKERYAIAKRCKQLIAENPDIDKNILAIVDIKKHLARIPDLEKNKDVAATLKPRKKARDTGAIHGEDTLIIDDSPEDKINEASQKREMADLIYNEGNYEHALIQYNQAYEILVQLEKQRGFAGGKEYNDTLVHILSDIIFTHCDIIMVTAPKNIKKAEKMFNELQSNIKEMETVYEGIKTLDALKCAQYIPLTYLQLARACEELSDSVIDVLDANNHVTNQKRILDAQKWLKKYTEYQNKAGETTELRVHVGYLYLLELSFKSAQELKYITQMNEYIQENALLELDLTPIQELEIRSYQLLAALETKNENCGKIAQHCQKLITENPDIDQNILVILDIKRHFARLAALEEHTRVSASNSRKRLREEEHVNPVKELHVQIEEASAVLNLFNVADQLDEKNARTVVIDVAAVSTLFTSPLSFFGGATRINKLSAKTYSVAFQKTMNELANTYNNAGFLADILSFIGDFYYTQQSPFFNKIYPAVAYDIYQSVLSLNENHPVAKDRLNELVLSNPTMISDHVHFGATSQGAAFFMSTIEKNLGQIEMHLAANTQEIGDVMDKLLQFVVEQMHRCTIVGMRTEEVAYMIDITYKEALLFSQEASSRNASSVY